MTELLATAAHTLRHTYELVVQEYATAQAEPPAPDAKTQAAQQRHRLALLRLLASTARELSALAKLTVPKSARTARISARAAAELTTQPRSVPPTETPDEASAVTALPPVLDHQQVGDLAEAHFPPPTFESTERESKEAVAPTIPEPAEPVPPARIYTPADVARVPDEVIHASIPAAYWAFRPNAGLRKALYELQQWRDGLLDIPGLMRA